MFDKILPRRSFLLGGASVLALAGCAPAVTPPGPVVTPLPSVGGQVLADITAVYNALKASLSNFQAFLPAGTFATVSGYVVQAGTILQQIVQAVGSTSTGGMISSFASVVSSIITAVTGAIGVTVPSWLSSLLSALQVVLPFILSAAGIALARRPGVTRFAAATPMDINVARQILIDIAAGKS